MEATVSYLIASAVTACLLLTYVGFGFYRVINRRGKVLSLLSATAKAKSMRGMCVLGSGGHTTEMIHLLDSLPAKVFASLTAVVAATDNHSEKKLKSSRFASALSQQGLPLSVFTVPRAREVGQSYFTSIFTTLRASLASMLVVLTSKPDAVILNGPGTCLPFAAASLLFNSLLFRNTQVIFVESFARTKELSLSGKLIYRLHLADRFFVQWRALADKYDRAEYVGVVC
uniref:UDP-N-acetylglucosamine transferase subunit ALG14 n=1 Tax=Palpitomonas bilix TaxID=652834 RepID=A0A7S3DKX3_9EUKA|mmetsp:Transcript_42263/g.108834  ORF Transcript_42263/g.108834 Transcript_42263/m.108834 type:complete len:229 (+) Transcript_42263:88-774(+)|eukprot:CAMPEP_0113903232 /NCGR_PEP_ID=MMETSP0780_2-20120614/22378_1 /TAXON_ID=652834 /ORGANISM="Palpitomonas bilix" /LENGTH=228 /DNA_ID=CAMNT_0000896299 /DNA_START=88 /DNA_END=774 /DNA_ORIENTATION=+ /assembly_acc=CAM_ASM_000599